MSCERTYSLSLHSEVAEVFASRLILWSSNACLWKPHVAIDLVVLPFGVSWTLMIFGVFFCGRGPQPGRFVETLGSPFVALCAACHALRHGKQTKRSRPGIAGPDPLRGMSVTPVGSLASRDQIMIGCRLPVACSIFPSCGHVAAQMQCGMVNRKAWPESAVVVSRYVFTVGGC